MGTRGAFLGGPIGAMAILILLYLYNDRHRAIKNILTGLKGELADKFHVSSLGLFGSVVRDDFNPVSSDIDIIVDFSRPIGIEFVDLADYLESKLSRPVDLVSKAGVKDKYFKEIESEIIYV